jgi:hypothetical protein
VIKKSNKSQHSKINPTKAIRSKLPRWSMGLIISIPILIAIGLSFLTGYPQFLVAKISCGHDPIMLDSGQRFIFNETSHYIIPYPGEPLYRVAVTNTYFCTEQQAQATGATIHPYSRIAIQRDSNK